MRLECPKCGARYQVSDQAIPVAGRNVQCGACSHNWFQRRAGAEAPGAMAAASPAAPAAAAPAAPAAAPDRPEVPAARAAQPAQTPPVHVAPAPAPTAPAPAAPAPAAPAPAAPVPAAPAPAAPTPIAAAPVAPAPKLPPATPPPAATAAPQAAPRPPAPPPAPAPVASTVVIPAPSPRPAAPPPPAVRPQAPKPVESHEADFERIISSVLAEELGEAGRPAAVTPVRPSPPAFTPAPTPAPVRRTPEPRGRETHALEAEEPSFDDILPRTARPQPEHLVRGAPVAPPPIDIEPRATPPRAARQASGGFSRGFATAFAFAVAFLAVYALRSPIAVEVPALAPALDAYAGGVDSLRRLVQSGWSGLLALMGATRTG